MIKTACHNKSEFDDLLPFIDVPFYGESLVGYLFRLSHINKFEPLAIIKQCIPEELQQISKL